MLQYLVLHKPSKAHCGGVLPCSFKDHCSFSRLVKSKKFWSKTSRQMFGHIHGALNIDKKTITQLHVNCETDLLNLIAP